MSAPPVRPSIVKYVYTHNPFYAISAVLMLYAIRTAYERLGIEAGNCWLMTGALAGYTLLLAVIGVWIVRWGRVWEDARSILLLLLLLFLAVSISADDLFVKAETSSTATTLLACGFLFAATVSEGVLWGARVRLGLRYRIPYHLMLALFFVAPWFYSPGVHPQFELWLDWLLLLFPVVAAVLFLSLLPAVRGGARYVAANGTPWPWPWFPGTAFAVIAGVVGLRSYALTMTFGLDGDIWRKLPSGRAIVFDTVWGTYFLVPLGFAIAILLLEVAFVAANRRVAQQVVAGAGMLLALALPWIDDPISHTFQQVVMGRIGSPFWLTTWGLIGFYAWAWFRGAPLAGRSVLLTSALLTVVGRSTLDLGTLTAPQPWPLLVVGALLLAHGVRVRSSWACATASLLVTAGLWFLLPRTPLAELRAIICVDLLWAACATIGFAFHDSLAFALRVVGAAMFPVSTLLAIASEPGAAMPLWLRALYLVVLGIVCLLVARAWRNLWYLYGFGGMVGVTAYAGAVGAFHRAANLLGRDAIIAFAWSFGTLLVALLISAQKARWLPRKMWPRWRNGHARTVEIKPSATTNGLSAEGS